MNKYIKLISTEILYRIHVRTRSGYDKFGKIFKPYSKVYIPVKHRFGYKGIVNLWNTGEMQTDFRLDLASVYVKERNIANKYINYLLPEEIKMKFDFNNEVEKHKYEENVAYGRDFVGISQAELWEIVERLFKDETIKLI
jgi:hypothetical protein